MKDKTINLNAAIEAINDYWGEMYEPNIDGYIECLKQLPPVTPQQPKGQWITEVKSDLRGDMWPTNPKCSICGKEPYYSNTIYNYSFCPYCGARMDGDDNER